MAIRNLLHKSQVQTFRDYAEKLGWSERPLVGIYEALRMVKPGEGTMILYTRNRGDHVSFSDEYYGLVKNFIKGKCENGNRK